MGAPHLRLLAGLVAILSPLGVACGEPARAPARDGADALKAGTEGTYAIPQFNKRPYGLHLPPAYSTQTPIPVVVVLHGGGGNADNAKKMTCPDGNAWSSGCMAGLADAEGFAVVYPNGTGSVVWESARTWNAGGGADGFQCVSGEACENGVDDVAYFDALYDERSESE